MTKKELISALKQLFPDLYIGNKYGEFISRGLVTFDLEDEGMTLPYYDPRWRTEIAFYKNLTNEEIAKLQAISTEEDFYRCLPYSSINDEILTIIQHGLYGCEVENLRHGDPNVNQLVLIHPDCDEHNIGEILRDAKHIYGEIGSWDGALAVINQGDWDFTNDELSMVLTDHTEDCFAYGEEEIDNFMEEEGFMKLYEQVKADYPDVDSMPFITTDYD